jgi:23S rRNA (cytosine1962-C5)-methyltransferase
VSECVSAEAGLQELRLRRREEHRLRNGHPWVFSNEVDISRTPLSGLEPGAAVSVLAHSGRVLGSALASPRSLICARLHSLHAGIDLGGELIGRRLRAALALRERLFPGPYYRMVYAESDGLPGLIVDRFGDVLCVQLATAGMERRRDAVVDALCRLVRPKAVILRNDGPGRAHEGLEAGVELALGEDPGAVAIEENGCRFQVFPVTGQKTGWFYDHRENRARLARLVADARVLDLFSYTGAWGIQAGCAGAREVLCVDTSRTALEQVAAHARDNGIAERVSVEVADAFEALRGLAARRREFDVVVLDPPAFVRRRKELAAGVEAYQRLNRLAMQIVAPGGFLVSASCSSHLPAERFLELVRRAARSAGRRAQVLMQGHQAPDHPVLPGFPEGAYLKAFTLRLSAED